VGDLRPYSMDFSRWFHDLIGLLSGESTVVIFAGDSLRTPNRRADRTETGRRQRRGSGSGAAMPLQ
jgi:hypothetical protein